MTEKKDIKKTIILMGDSFTFGHGCSDRVYYWDNKIKDWVGKMWASGAGPSEYCWGSLIEKTFNSVSVINRSEPGKDNISCFSDLLFDIKEYLYGIKIDALIFLMSFDDRIQIAPPEGFVDDNFTNRTKWRPIDYFKDYLPLKSWSPSWPVHYHESKEVSKNYKLALEYYAEQLYSPAWGAKLSHTSLFAAKGLADSIGAKFYWSSHSVLSTNNNKYTEYLKHLRIPNMVDYLHTLDHSPLGEKYRTPDGHANDVGHERYFREVIKPFIEREIL